MLGVKRAAYALLTGQAIDAKTALEYGMVNEVVPRAKLLERAWTIADHIMTQPRTTRRMTTQIVRRPWRRQITDSLDGGFAMQMFAHLAKKTAAHGRGHIGERWPMCARESATTSTSRSTPVVTFAARRRAGSVRRYACRRVGSRVKSRRRTMNRTRSERSGLREPVGRNDP